MPDKIAKLCQSIVVARARVAQAEGVYRRERALSEVSTWKYCTLEIPGACIFLKSAEARRAQALASAQWSALDALSALPTSHANIIEERTRQAASLKGRQWLDATM